MIGRCLVLSTNNAATTFFHPVARAHVCNGCTQTVIVTGTRRRARAPRDSYDARRLSLAPPHTSGPVLSHAYPHRSGSPAAGERRRGGRRVVQQHDVGCGGVAAMVWMSDGI